MTRRPRGYWRSLSNIKYEVRPIAESHLKETGNLPAGKDLREEGLGGALSALSKYHKLGLDDLWQELGYDPQNPKSVFQELGYNPASAPEKFKKFVNNEEVARDVIEFFGGNLSDVIAVLCVIYPNLFVRKELTKLFHNTGLSDWIHSAHREFNSPTEMLEKSARLLHFDQEDFLKDLVYNQIQKYIRKDLGPRPSESEVKEILEELRSFLDSEPESEPVSQIGKQILEYFEDIYRMWKNGIPGVVSKIEKPDFF